jgi:hypothetical protein
MSVAGRQRERSGFDRSAPPLTLAEARAFIAAVPWRAVQMREVGDTGKTPDPHQYVILDWREVPREGCLRFVELIRRTGYRATYRAPYRPEYEMTNHYLELDGWCYWWIGPKMLNRERAADRKHVPIPDDQLEPATDSR